MLQSPDGTPAALNRSMDGGSTTVRRGKTSSGGCWALLWHRLAARKVDWWRSLSQSRCSCRIIEQAPDCPRCASTDLVQGRQVHAGAHQADRPCSAPAGWRTPGSSGRSRAALRWVHGSRSLSAWLAASSRRSAWDAEPVDLVVALNELAISPSQEWVFSCLLQRRLQSSSSVKLCAVRWAATVRARLALGKVARVVPSATAVTNAVGVPRT